MSQTRAANRYNVDAQSVALPEIEIDGAVYRGRVLSIDEWFAFADRFDAQIKRESAAKPEELPQIFLQTHALMLDFLRMIFPAGRAWRSAFRRVDPVAALEVRGRGAVVDAFQDLFEHQMVALRLVPRHLKTPPKTDGTSSPDRTTPAPSANDNDSATS